MAAIINESENDLDCLNKISDFSFASVHMCLSDVSSKSIRLCADRGYPISLTYLVGHLIERNHFTLLMDTFHYVFYMSFAGRVQATFDQSRLHLRIFNVVKCALVENGLLESVRHMQSTDESLTQLQVESIKILSVVFVEMTQITSLDR